MREKANIDLISWNTNSSSVPPLDSLWQGWHDNFQTLLRILGAVMLSCLIWRVFMGSIELFFYISYNFRFNPISRLKNHIEIKTPCNKPAQRRRSASVSTTSPTNVKLREKVRTILLFLGRVMENNSVFVNCQCVCVFLSLSLFSLTRVHTF